MEIKGIDVSSYQGDINWKTVADYGMDFVVLRITEKGNKTDSKFEKNYKGCVDNGIPVGVYKYSYAKTIEEAETEADVVLKVLNGRKLDFPIFYDLEWKEQRPLGKSTIEKIAKAFLRKIKKAGYLYGLYSNVDWHNNVFTENLRKYDCWVASYPDEESDNGWLQERLRPSVGVGWQYSQKAKIPGISGYVDRDVFYKDYKSEEVDNVGVTAQDVLNIMRSWLGYSEINGKFRQIIDLYNSHKPLARGYAVQYDDEWCDATVSAAAIKAGAVDLIGTECGVEEHVNIFKKKGIWIEDGTITPLPGDIIVYNWNDNTQPNDGYSDHIGYVENVSGRNMTAIEGNKGSAVTRRSLIVGDGNIRGYARPKYAKTSGGTGSGTQEGGTYMFNVNTVKSGDSGNHVLLVQEILKARGFKGADGKELTLDKQCGANTVYAIKQYQKQREAADPGSCGGVDGIAGEKTLRDMIAL